MQKGKWSWLQIIPRMVALMSGLLSLGRELLSIYDPAYQGRIVFWNCVRIAFIISAAIAWWMEHKKVEEVNAEKDAAIAKLTQKPDIDGEILAVFWEPSRDPYSTSENIHSRYYVRLRLVNQNDVPCTIDEYRILVNSIYGDQPCQGKGIPSRIGKLRHPTSAYQDEFTYTEPSPVAIIYDKSPKPPRGYQPDTWTQTMTLDIPRHLPLERARKVEGWVTFEVGNYIPSPLKTEDATTKEYLAFAPWQQNITIIVVDSLGGEHLIKGEFVSVAPSTFSVD